MSPAIQCLHDIPSHWAAKQPSALALHDLHGDWSWAELEARKRSLAADLAQLGVRRGDRVMIVGENSALLVALLFAVSTAGAWIVNVNARLSEREIAAIRKHCDARRVLYLEDSPDARRHAQGDGASAFTREAWARLRVSALNAGCVPEPVEEDPSRDVAALLYTTGTTGDPKGVMLTHANLLFIAAAARTLRHITPEDRVYGLLPISHVYGLASVCLGTLFAGASLHLQPRFLPASMAEFVVERDLTVCQGVPAMYAKLLEHLRSTGAAFHAPRLRFLYAGGSPLALALKREVEAFFGLTLHNGYGLTEASPTVTQTRHEEPRSDCSVGRPVPGVEIRIVDLEGRDVATDTPGELWVRGPNVMKGYYRNPEATAEAILPGGWLATGDIARQARDGALHIEGRLKELIIRSGFNVFPVEVEAVLNAHPEVTQSAVVGRSTGSDEEVVAFVELVPGSKLTPRALLDFAAASLAPYKRPAEVIVMAALPAAANGKILKGRLKEMAREGYRAS
jgi:acyl-CoA synthetase (AMP-forming)/AMP-acid ligase II